MGKPPFLQGEVIIELDFATKGHPHGQNPPGHDLGLISTYHQVDRIFGMFQQAMGRLEPRYLISQEFQLPISNSSIYQFISNIYSKLGLLHRIKLNELQ